MSITLPVEAGLIYIFSQAVGDFDPVYVSQLQRPNEREVVAPLTYVRSAEHFDMEGDLMMWPGGERVPEGGGAGRLHAEQHFEYLKPLVAGDRLTARTFDGDTWVKQGRSGTLTFVEMHTEFYDGEGDLAIKTRKVSVRVGSGEES